MNEQENKIKKTAPDFVVLPNKKTAKFKDIGKIFTQIESFFFEYLNGYNIPTAFLNSKGNEITFLPINEIGITFSVQNCVNKAHSKIFKVKENSKLEIPLIDVQYMNEKPYSISESHIHSFSLMNALNYKTAYRISTKANAVLKSFFERRGYFLKEMNLNFGVTKDNRVLLTGSFSPLSISICEKENDKIHFFDTSKITDSKTLNQYTSLIMSIISV